MKKKDAIPGTKVLASIYYNDYYGSGGPGVGPFYIGQYDDYTLVGVILSRQAAPGKVWVKWIDGEIPDQEEEEVDLKILSLESERPQLEKEFKLIEKQVKEKMKQAAALVNEAGKLAKKVNIRSLEEMYDAVGPLVNAMDNNGWRSSSWGC